MLSEGFKRVTPIQDSSVITDRLLHVNSVAGLIQAIGYIKWMVANSKKEKEPYGVVFRGQCDNYPSMIPSLYRGIEKSSSKPSRDAKLKKMLNSLSIPHQKKVEGYLGVKDSLFVEPLLQHYGVQTSWLDVVDNIWIALWFACHRCIKDEKYKPLVSFLKRHQGFNFENEKNKKKEKLVYESYCFISLLSVPLSLSGKTDETGKKQYAGHYSTKRAEVIDLRYCVPSFYLRPHVQHGLVMRMKSKEGESRIDYKDSVEAVIRIDLVKALEWISEDNLLTTRNLFPPPHIDTGLSLLLGIPELKPYLNLPMA